VLRTIIIAQNVEGGVDKILGEWLEPIAVLVFTVCLIISLIVTATQKRAAGLGIAGFGVLFAAAVFMGERLISAARGVLGWFL
jgi:uncharacterized membrane protein